MNTRKSNAVNHNVSLTQYLLSDIESCSDSVTNSGLDTTLLSEQVDSAVLPQGLSIVRGLVSAKFSVRVLARLAEAEQKTEVATEEKTIPFWLCRDDLLHDEYVPLHLLELRYTKDWGSDYVHAKMIAEKARAAGLPPKKPVEFAPIPFPIRQRKKRNDHGFTKLWSAMCFASLCVAAIIGCAIYMQSSKKSTFYQYPDNYLRILKNLDPCESDGTCGYRRLVQSVVKGVPNPETVMQFCQKPRFEQGHTLNWIKVIDNGSCWEVDGWSPLTDSTGRDSLAGNCNPDFSQAKEAGHVACEGGKARF